MQWIITGMKTVALQRSISCETPVKCQQDGEDNVAGSDFTVLYDLFLPTCSNIITPWKTKSEIVGIQEQVWIVQSCSWYDVLCSTVILCSFSTNAFFFKMLIFFRGEKNVFTVRMELNFIYLFYVNTIHFKVDFGGYATHQ